MNVDYHGGSAEGVIRLLCFELCNPLCKGFVRNFLEVFINGENDRVSLLRLLDVFCCDIAVVVLCSAFHAVCAAQVFFHCLFDAVFADGIGLEIAFLFIFFIFIFTDCADHAEDMGSKRAIHIFAVWYDLNLNALIKIAFFFDFRYRLGGNIFREGVWRALTEHQAVHLIVYGSNFARLFRRIFLEAVFFNERIQAILRGCITVNMQDFI